MNCQKFEQVVGELAHGRMMEAEVRGDALAHSEECAVCLARLRDEETLTRGLQLLAADMESLSAPPELELTLRQAFQQQRKVVVPMARRSVGPRYWWAAVAAVLLVAMTVAAMWWRSTAPQQEVANKATPPKQVETPSGPREQPAPKPAEYTAVNEPSKGQPQTPSKSIHRNTTPRRAPETPMANHVSNEIATDFMPLGDFSAVSLQDGGQIVRVKLRRSALVRFGLPVNMDRYNENVKADVLVGVDGLAHAIRFVQ
ncbi:MAG TPA: hypothetical protein VJ749_01705 [Pyrinomonadaceae bacterium]|nr:hypothetical protein [Pyrinomonadaceae bacterium]